VPALLSIRRSDAPRPATPSQISVTAYDAAVLDLGLPDGDGRTLLADLQSSPKKVLVLTARDAVEDRVSGLDAGADDYFVKPFLVAPELHAPVDIRCAAMRDLIGMIAELVCDGSEDHGGALPAAEFRDTAAEEEGDLPRIVRCRATRGALRGRSDPVSVPMNSQFDCNSQ